MTDNPTPTIHVSQTLHVCYIYICTPISWGGFGRQYRHIWQSHGVSGYGTFTYIGVVSRVTVTMQIRKHSVWDVASVSKISYYSIPKSHPLKDTPKKPTQLC